MDEWIYQIKIFKGYGNQLQFNTALNVMKKSKQGLNVGIVDCAEFPNGALMNDWEAARYKYWNPFHSKHFQLVHANYLKGIDAKRNRLKKLNAWFL